MNQLKAFRRIMAGLPAPSSIADPAARRFCEGVYEALKAVAAASSDGGDAGRSRYRGTDLAGVEGWYSLESLADGDTVRYVPGRRHGFGVKPAGEWPALLATVADGTAGRAAWVGVDGSTLTVEDGELKGLPQLVYEGAGGVSVEGTEVSAVTDGATVGLTDADPRALTALVKAAGGLEGGTAADPGLRAKLKAGGGLAVDAGGLYCTAQGEVYTAGTAIAISAGNVISGAYEAGTNVTISGAVISASDTTYTGALPVEISAQNAVGLRSDAGQTLAATDEVYLRKSDGTAYYWGTFKSLVESVVGAMPRSTISVVTDVAFDSPNLTKTVRSNVVVLGADASGTESTVVEFLEYSAAV